MDNDGDIDQVMSGDGTDQMYRNDGGAAFNKTWESDLADVTSHSALGDYDNDGDLDYLAGDTEGNNLYRNDRTGALIWNWKSDMSIGQTLSIAFADIDNDNDLDHITDSGGTTRVYTSEFARKRANTVPSVPSGFASKFSYSISGSTLAFKWDASQYDTGFSSNSVYFQVAVSTHQISATGNRITSSTLTVTGIFGSTMLGNYVRPAAKIWSEDGDSGVKHRLAITGAPVLPNTTYYWRVQTIDSSLAKSNWSDQQTVSYYYIPALITNLLAATTGPAQVQLQWTAPSNGIGAACSQYSVKYSTTATIISDADFSNASTWTQSWTPKAPGQNELYWLTGLIPETNYWFSIKGYNGTLWSAVSSTSTSTCRPETFWLRWDSHVTDNTYSIVLGDYDNDGDLDQVVGNYSGQYNNIFRNDAGTYIKVAESVETDDTQSIALGDCDNDGDLDQVVGNYGVKNRLYRNDGGTYVKVWDSSESDTTYSIALGDYDNDGDLDHVAGNGIIGDGRNKLYRNDGGTYVKVWDSSESESTYSIALGDYDNDGDLDHVAGNTGYKNRLYRNDGGTYVKVWDSAMADFTSSIALGDYDNDGDLDQIEGNTNQKNRLYRNDGGTYVKIWDSDEADYTYSIALGDYDNDGDLDQFAGNAGHKSRLYRNDGGSYIKVWETDRADATHSIALGDIDNDGDLDQVVGNVGKERLYLSEHSLRKGNSHPLPPDSFALSSTNGYLNFAWSKANGTYDTETSSSGVYFAVRIGTGSATSNPTASSSTVSGTYGSPLLGNYLRPKLPGTDAGLKISLQGLKTLTTYYWSIRTIDTGLRAGGWSVEQSTCIPAQTPGTVNDLTAASGSQITLSWTSPFGDPASYELRYTTYQAVNSGNWGAATVWSQAWPPQPSGSPETKILTGLTPETTYWFGLKATNSYGTSAVDATTPRPYAVSGVFSLMWSSSFADDNAAIVLGDYDNDGDIDQLVGNGSNQKNRLYRNDSGTYVKVWDSSETDVTYSIALGDYDNDGDLDQVAGNFLSNRLYRNEGGTYIKVWDSAETDNTYSISFGDFDNDGDLDQVAGNRGHNVFYRNDGGAYATTSISGENMFTHSVALGDYDNDGDIDMVAGTRNGLPDTTYNNRHYRNDAGTFVKIWESFETDYTFSIALGDYDNDGDLDHVAGNNGQNNRLYRNDAGTFVKIWNSYETDSTFSIALGDYDNDGDLDQVAGNNNQSNRLYRNDGGTYIKIWDSSETDTTRTISLGDLDGDGDLDHIAGNSGVPSRLYTSLYSLKRSNTAPNAPSGFAAKFDYSVARSTITFKWDPAVGNNYDTISSSNALYYQVAVSTHQISATGSRITSSTLTVTGIYGSPLLGTYLRPPVKNWNGDGSKHGLQIWGAPVLINTTYYWRVQTIDSGLAKSDWSAQQQIALYTPALVTNLFAATTGPAQVQLQWTAPSNGIGAACSQYSVRYSTTATIISDADFTNASTWTQSWTPKAPGQNELYWLTGLIPETNYWFSIKGYNGTLWSAVSSTKTSTCLPQAFWKKWDSFETDNTNIIALGDYDNDGDLDHVAGNGSSQRNRLYRNDAGIFIKVWDSAETDSTVSVDLGDYDNDGDLDQIAGNASQRNRLYRNDAGAYVKVWDTAETDLTYVTVFSDYDNDGDLDHVAGNSSSKNRLYRNDAGTYIKVWDSSEMDGTYSIALGDYDNDGDLDQMVGNYAERNRLYRNDAGAYVKVWDSYETDNTRNITLYDYDNDGDLDQVAGNNGMNRLYRNDAGSYAKIWDSSETDNTYSIALGDYDNDGDLDQLTGNYNEKNRLYRNDGGSYVKLWDSSETDSTRSMALGDLDNDGDLDHIAGNYSQKNRLYLSEYAVRKTNTQPGAPDTFAVSSANGYLNFTWAKSNGSYDTETSSSGVYFAVRVGTGSVTSNPAASSSTVSGAYGSPLLGNYLRPKMPPNAGFKLALRTGTTYYWAVRTIDTGLRAGGWSVEQSTYVPSRTPDPVNNLAAASGYQLSLNWTSPLGDASSYELRYSTWQAVTAGSWSAATVWPQSWPPAPAGALEIKVLTGLIPETTYWFGITASNAYGTSTCDTTNPRPFALPGAFILTWRAGASYANETTAVGDYDNDGDLDHLLAGNGEPNYLYRNDSGAFTKVWNSADASGAKVISFFDFDNDGDLDHLLGTMYEQNRLYRNDAGSFNKVWDSSESDDTYSLAFGDCDNDGDLDQLVGNASSKNRLYRNDAGTFIKVWDSPLADVTLDIGFGDFDSDGDLDHLAVNGASVKNRLYRNDSGSFVMTWEAAVTDQYVSLALGDFDNDGDLDQMLANNNRLNRLFRNDAGGFVNTWDSSVTKSARSIAAGDYDSDGDLDHMVTNTNNTSDIYRNDAGSHVQAWSSEVNTYDNCSFLDADSDGDLDVLLGIMNGPQVLYTSFYSLKRSNAAPSAPSGFAAKFDYSVARSTITFKWDPEVGSNYDTISSSNALYYQVAVSTHPISATGSRITSSTLTVTGIFGSPLLGNYLRPPVKDWNGDGSKHGLQIWGAPVKTDSTYYWRVKTIDSGLAQSDWNATDNTLVTTVPPANITTLAAMTGTTPGTLRLSWQAPGDDQFNGNISGGIYRVRYATYTTGSDAFWTDAASNWTDQINKYQVQWTTNTSPYAAESYTLSNLTYGATYYVRLWTRDEVTGAGDWGGGWSSLSNCATTYALALDLSLDVTPYLTLNFGSVPAGSSAIIASSFAVTNMGNIAQKYRLQLTGVPAAWTVKETSGATGFDQIKLLALFTTSTPTDSNFTDDSATNSNGDIVRASTYDVATSSNYAIVTEGAAAKGYACPIGERRYLWFKFVAPDKTSVVTTQLLTVTVSAVQDP